MQTFKTIGILVTIGRTPHVVNPSTPIFEKWGKKQFWFNFKGRAWLAIETKYGWRA